MIGILATVGIFYFGSVGMIGGRVSAVAGFNNTFKYNNISNLIILCATFSYAASFCIDWQTRFAYSLIIRSDKTSYALSKCISTAFVGGLSVTIGAAIFISYLCATQTGILPTANEIENEFAPQAFGDLLVQGKATLFFVSYLYIIFIQGLFFSSLGLLVSAFMPNKYIAYISPFALCFVLNQIANVYDLPIWLNPVKLATARVFNTPTSTILLRSTATFLLLAILCDLSFIHTVKRRIANG